MARRISLSFLIAFASAFAFLWGTPKYAPPHPRDGFGSNHRIMAETALGKPLALSTLPACAKTTTSDVFGKTTDSAAAGTAIACGIKTSKKAIGVDKDGNAVRSLAMRLKEQGFKIGIISSSPLNDATPAAHYAHQSSRNNYRAITDELAASGFDFFGGQIPLKDKKESEEESLEKTLQACKKNGYVVFTGKSCIEGSRQTSSSRRVCLWQTPAISYFYRPAQGPTLADFTREAIRRLDNPVGFFLVVEQGNIDYSSHCNDAGKLMWEILDFDQAIKAGLDFQKSCPEETLVVLTADHETGGLQLNRPDSSSLKRLFGQTHSLIELQEKIATLAKEGAPQARDEAMHLLETALFPNEALFSQTEQQRFNTAWDEYIAALKNTKRKGAIAGLQSKYGRYISPVIEAFRIRDERAKIRFTSFNHSDTAVLTSAVGPGQSAFSKEMDNTDIPKKIEAILFGQTTQ